MPLFQKERNIDSLHRNVILHISPTGVGVSIVRGHHRPSVSRGTGSKSCRAAAAGDLSAAFGVCVCVCEQVLRFAGTGLWFTKWVPGALQRGCLQSVLLHIEEATLL